MEPSNRREFLKRSTGTAAVLWGTSRAWAGANDRIRIASIGAGGRGASVMQSMAGLPKIEVAAVCDPDETRMRKAASELDSLTGKSAKQERDLRRILDDPNIDAVVLTCCNHWHSLAGIWACQAGKHVYVEKPVSHNFVEGRKLVEASRKYKRIVQGGTQRRSHPNFRKAIEAIHDGVIGDVYMARWLLPSRRESIGFKKPEAPPPNLDWNLWRGPAREQAYHANLVHYNWHWFWDFGGGEMGNNGSHSIDISHWALRKGFPARVSSIGGRFGYKDQGETPNTLTTTYEYADGTLVAGEIRGHYTSEERDWHFYGTKGHMRIVGEGNFQVFLGESKRPEPGLGNPPEVEGGFDTVDTIQFENFFEAVRSGKRGGQYAEIEEIFTSNALCLLANISYRLNREVRFDAATEKFVADEEADRLLTREYHPEFAAPEKV